MEVIYLLPALYIAIFGCKCITGLPTVVTTWPYPAATNIAFETLLGGGSPLDAVVEGCHFCDMRPDVCGESVGPGRPNEQGETTLDALVMDGLTHKAGAVGCLRRVQEATKVAYAVMMYTSHTFLVGEDATQFALSMGFNETSLETEDSMRRHEQWVNGNCQPNNWKNVEPDPETSCGPYHPVSDPLLSVNSRGFPGSPNNHDTIGMVAVDADHNVATGTSTNGMLFKIAGRVGDSPIPGSGGYADNAIGGAAATGDGDIMMRFLPSYNAVNAMGQGLSPSEAAEVSIANIASKVSAFHGALVVMNIYGEYGAACYGFGSFNFTIRESGDETARFEVVPCIG